MIHIFMFTKNLYKNIKLRFGVKFMFGFELYSELKEQCSICKVCDAAEEDCNECSKGNLIREYEKFIEQKTFYYTFGSDEQFPYKNGWVEVIAESHEEADKKFRRRFTDVHTGILNCAFVYTEDDFPETIMAQNGNLQGFCHEIIE